MMIKKVDFFIHKHNYVLIIFIVMSKSTVLQGKIILHSLDYYYFLFINYAYNNMYPRWFIFD